MENMLVLDKTHFIFIIRTRDHWESGGFSESSQPSGSSPAQWPRRGLVSNKHWDVSDLCPLQWPRMLLEGQLTPSPFCTDLRCPLGGVHHSAYFSYQNRNVCLFSHCLNLISPPPLPTSLSVTPPYLSPFLCSHSKLKEGERAREKRLFSCKRHRDERLPTQSVIAGKMGLMHWWNESRKESVDFWDTYTWDARRRRGTLQIYARPEGS